jgi:hypothetical protein
VSLVPSNPFERGQAACRVGIPRTAVPYDEDSLAYEHWLEGWNDWHYFVNPGERPEE